MNEIHSLLHYSLNEALHHIKCATAAWMSSDIGQMRIMNSDVKTLYWIDEDFEMISISFPAKLNLEGCYSQLTFEFNNDSSKKVSSSDCHVLVKDISSYHQYSNQRELYQRLIILLAFNYRH